MAGAASVQNGIAAVYFMDGPLVDREMRASEFDAFLDGYVGLTDLVDTDVRAVYAVLDESLSIHALVFFRIYFDDEGRADTSWNVPIERLAAQGAAGPDLGSGPIRLVCRSQCPEPEYAQELWDPDMSPGSNHFLAIRRAVEANALRFPKAAKPVADAEIPVLKAETRTEPGEDFGVERTRLARMIKEYRLRVKTPQSVHRDTMADMQRSHRLELQAVRGALSELEQKYERQRVTTEQLRTKLAERNQQYLTMQESIAKPVGNQQAAGQADAEIVLLREQLARRQRELEMRNDKIVQLQDAIEELQRREPADDTLMRHLKDQDVFLVAYHAGIGHLTLPYDDIEGYFCNPIAYAADKCGVNEPAYREWLNHYENPVCQHTHDDGQRCGQPLMRISQPSEFSAGVDDRCEAHR